MIQKWLTLMMLPKKTWQNIIQVGQKYHPCRVLIIGSSGSGKTNSLINLINQQLDVYKTYVFAKESYKVKYQFLINKREFTGLKHFHDSKVFI